ncbi:hypothetical protein J6590_074287 [Homalodisca vitripennis]|nr:hypothetical protein J6590_074287 [Homalodisca vitripennis]
MWFPKYYVGFVPIHGTKAQISAPWRASNVGQDPVQSCKSLDGFVSVALHLLNAKAEEHLKESLLKLSLQLDVAYLEWGTRWAFSSSLHPLVDSGHNQAELECRLLNVSHCDQRSKFVGIANEEAIWHQQAVVLPGRIKIDFHLERYEVNHAKLCYCVDKSPAETVASVSLARMCFSITFPFLCQAYTRDETKVSPVQPQPLGIKTRRATPHPE